MWSLKGGANARRLAGGVRGRRRRLHPQREWCHSAITKNFSNSRGDCCCLQPIRIFILKFENVFPCLSQSASEIKTSSIAKSFSDTANSKGQMLNGTFLHFFFSLPLSSTPLSHSVCLRALCVPLHPPHAAAAHIVSQRGRV